MTAEIKESVYKGVDLHSKTNNTEHHTSVISKNELIVRRGQPFKLTLNLAQPFTPDAHPLKIVAVTGKHPEEERGTKSLFGVPDNQERSPKAKAVWKAELDKGSYPLMGNLNLTITPPASTPVGQYNVHATYKNEEKLLAVLVVLFNPWCPDDWVFLPDEEERKEYVMNEQGIIYKGSGNYISPMSWDFGQFEENMVKICLAMLDLNHKHLADPADDVSARCNPIYVSRVVSAMINSEDDRGVLQGSWQAPFWGGVAPSHWSGSYPILKKWYNIDCYPVKYGQCWVFAGVMCSVMRLLGIPCRVVTNYQSAHDNNRNLTIDVYHADYGVREKESKDSVWNYHVWVEGWMRRPDLAEDGKYDGWQVLDPTPQEKSEGVYCCGPAPVVAVREGETELKYDIPFVYAEVNADCIDWLVKADGSLQNIWSDINKVGQNISTKSVGSRKRMNITDSYKYREGTDKERSVFTYASTRNFPGKDDKEEKKEGKENQSANGPVDNGGTEGNGIVNGTTGTTGEVSPNTPPNGTTGTTAPSTPPPPPPPPPVSIRFEEVDKPMDGKDVSLNVVLRSESTVARPLSINISVQGMMYNGTPAVNIQTEVKEGTLQPGKDLSIPILIPFSTYNKHMVNSDSMKVSAMVKDKQNPEHVYLAENDIVLLDPPISITVSTQARLNREVGVEVVFMNPVKETLKQCTLTLSGSGLLRQALECSIPDLKPNTRIRVNFFIVPYKIGNKTLVADFDCSAFRDIKSSCTFNVALS